MTINAIAQTELADEELQQKLNKLIEAHSNPESKKDREEYLEHVADYLAEALIVPQKVLNQPFTI